MFHISCLFKHKACTQFLGIIFANPADFNKNLLANPAICMNLPHILPVLKENPPHIPIFRQAKPAQHAGYVQKTAGLQK